jgi:NAD(P)-dependent dehydrogenase (short-subunit alcohol dehydrogenase family)
MTTTLVTGANRGIGLALCELLKQQKHDVIGVCRSTSKALDALSVRVESGIDVSEPESLTALGKKLGSVRIDWLICNAGIMRGESLGKIDYQTVREQLEVNALGPLRTVEALLPCLTRGSKIGLMTSRMGSIADNGSGGMYGYRMSKAALNAAGMSLARDLRERGIAVAILHPGFVRTDMTSQHGNVAAGESAAQLIARMDELTLEQSGSFLHANGETLPW